MVDSPPRLDAGHLLLGQERVPLLSGAVHYWRLPPEHWRRALVAVRELGMPMVETYAPWGVHETGRGEFDFGRRDPRKDLGAFLDLAAELGLRAIVRPGPHINAELTYFGLPARVVEDPDCQAKSPRAQPVMLYFPPRMFPVPSYASESYFEETGRWYDAVAEVLRPRLWPAGNVVMVQVDNELGFFFRAGPFCQDYHDDAIGLWHEFLATRYGDLGRAAAVHQQSYVSWGDVDPPRAWEGSAPGALARQLDWAHFHEELHTTALRRFRQRLERAGITGIPFLHNLSLGEAGLPVSYSELAAEVDLVGLDYYHAAGEHRSVKRRTLLLAGSSELPYSPELGVGAPPWFTPMSHHDSLYTALVALAYGLRGYNLYMAVDRSRWYGAAIDSAGTVRPEGEAWRRLTEALRAIDFASLVRPARVGLQMPAEYRRLTRATHVLGALSPAIVESLGGTPVDACRVESLGFSQTVQTAWWDDLATIADALTQAGVPYVYLDGEAPLERLEPLSVVYAPSYDFAAPERWDRLQEYAAGGGHVVYGPTLPTLDEAMRQTRFADIGGPPTQLEETDGGSLVHALIHEWIDRFELARPYPALPPVETSLHRDRQGRDVVLFVMNPSQQATTARVRLEHPRAARDLLDGTEFSGEKLLEIPMAPTSARMLQLAGVGAASPTLAPEESSR